MNEQDLADRRLHREREARKAAERLLEEKSRELFRINTDLEAALDQVNDMQHRLQMALWAGEETIWEWEAASDEVREQTFRDIHGNAVFDRYPLLRMLQRAHPDDVGMVWLAWQQHLFGLVQHYQVEYRTQTAVGWRWVRARGRATDRDDLGLALRVTGMLKDVTALREVEESQRLLAAAFSSTQDAMLILGADHIIHQANDAFLELTGLSAEKVLGRKASTLLSCTTSDLLSERLTQAEIEPWRGELLTQRANGGAAVVEANVSPVRNPTGTLTHLVMSVRDISEKRKQAVRLERLARYDALTGLPNRQHLEDAVSHGLQQRRIDEVLAVMFIDLDGFKEINDSLGHAAGDMLLQEVAKRLMATLRRRDLVSRWGGDEFVVLLEPLRQLEEVDRVIEKVQVALDQPFLVGGHQVSVTLSMGISACPMHGEDVQTLLRHADSAMYEAKRTGRNRSVLYRPEMNEHLLERVKLANLLRRAPQNGELYLVLQPKVDPKTERLAGAEVLMRWKSAELGQVSPTRFIPLAEELGLMELLGRWLVDESMTLAGRWQRDGWDLHLAINLSARQFRDEQMPAKLQALAVKQGVPPGRIELEITESVLLEDVNVARKRVGELKDMGFRLALDDFGTGYSSLSYLKELPFDRVKIDRSFISDLGTAPRSIAMLSGIVALCKGLGLEVTAEGVETPAQLAIIRAEGVDEVQGYYYHPPLMLEDFDTLMAHVWTPADTGT